MRELFVCPSAGKMFKGEVIVLGVKDVDAALFYTIGEIKLMEICRQKYPKHIKPIELQNLLLQFIDMYSSEMKD